MSWVFDTQQAGNEKEGAGIGEGGLRTSMRKTAKKKKSRAKQQQLGEKGIRLCFTETRSVKAKAIKGSKIVKKLRKVFT